MIRKGGWEVVAGKSLFGRCFQGYIVHKKNCLGELLSLIMFIASLRTYVHAFRNVGVTLAAKA